MKNGIYKPDKSRSRVEVRVNAGDSYDSTAYKACASLGMYKHDNCILLRLTGAVIPKKGIESEDWTIMWRAHFRGNPDQLWGYLHSMRV